ncbi:DUF3152 domain-containing protein [Streptomyces sp. NPDC006012]|uniref:DUF3152 domain-containing protein n=1 Tax=Streptomyces sp. NPDC006012 TaxID=3364739 RepID=UPI00369E77CA
MGRHSRRGSASRGDNDITAGDTAPGPQAPAGAPGGAAPDADRVPAQAPRRGAAPGPPSGPAQGPFPGQRRPSADGPPGRGFPRPNGESPARGVQRTPDGTPAHGFPRVPGGTPAGGVPRPPDGTPAHGSPRLPDGTPAHGFPGVPGGTPARGVPRPSDGTPAHGVPPVRGGHPEQREAGGGWGEFAGQPGAGPSGAPGPAAAGPGATLPRQRSRRPGGPRQEYLDAFDSAGDEAFALHTEAEAGARQAEPYGSTALAADGIGARPADGTDDDLPTGPPAPGKGGMGRAFTGIAAAAVTTVLAVIVAGQVADHPDDAQVQPQSATDQARDAREPASRDGRTTPSASPRVVAPTYAQKMATKYPLSATLKGSGKFDAVPGFAKAPGTGQKYTYRVDVEQGLGLDGGLFAQAVQKTLNDRRSWAHGGGRTFERISSGEPDFVITLASPGTTAEWCAKSGLDTTVDNVSCDSAATQRVVINAYRWAQGSKTYGNEIYAYRQMLINHEVGHRLGHNHVSCEKSGELAPVMQQQTKFLDHDGIHCLANPWPYPGS